MLFICRCEDFSQDMQQKLFLLSDADRREKAAKLPEGDKRTVSLAAGLLKKLLKEKYGFKYVSISHSGNFAGALGENEPCGLDIEKLQPRERKVVERVCTEEEIKRIDASENPQEEFIKLWTMKEASFKAGMGNSLFDFFKENAEIESLKKNYEYETEIIEGYAVTTCKLKKWQTIRIIINI